MFVQVLGAIGLALATSFSIYAVACKANIEVSDNAMLIAGIFLIAAILAFKIVWAVDTTYN